MQDDLNKIGQTLSTGREQQLRVVSNNFCIENLGHNPFILSKIQSGLLQSQPIFLLLNFNNS